MPLPSITPKSTVPTLLGGTARTLVAGLALVLLAAAILASPGVLRLIDDEGVDWGRLGDIGQSYGPVSALLSALALCVIVMVQRHQLRQERVLMAREAAASAVRTAMEDPAYCQCWGPRVTPGHIDERLFYYTNTIINAWMYAWECGTLSDGAVRAYARAMADSEVPREYWRMHGGWRLLATRGRQRRFLDMVDGEFRAAVAAGPPARGFERPAGAGGSGRCCAAPPAPRGRRRPRTYRGQGPDRTIRMKSRH